MCQDHDDGGGGGGAPSPPTKQQPTTRDDAEEEPFPWHLGALDAHCHPTEFAASIDGPDGLGSMKTQILTIMATRSQDQHLVAEVAARWGVRPDRDALPEVGGERERERVVPAFGWHPWLAHELVGVDDEEGESGQEEGEEEEDEGNQEEEKEERKKHKHYASVLYPPPSSPAFTAHLPTPLPLSAYLVQLRQHLVAHPLALVGEVGIDRAFRLPEPPPPPPPPLSSSSSSSSTSTSNNMQHETTPGGRAGRRLSPHRVAMAHQIAVLQAQLRLAGELGRPASVHGVQAHGVLFGALAGLWKGDLVEVRGGRRRRVEKMIARGVREDWSSSGDDDDSATEDGEKGMGESKKKKKKKTPDPKPFPPRLCLHSFSGSPQTLSQYTHPSIPCKIFFSFSVLVNLGSSADPRRNQDKFAQVVKACPDDRILVESDMHRAGAEMDRMVEDMYRRVCKVKGWGLEEGVRRVRRNWEEFVFG